MPSGIEQMLRLETSKTHSMYLSRRVAGRKEDRVQIQKKMNFTYKISGKDTGKQEQTLGNIKHWPTKTEWNRGN